MAHRGQLRLSKAQSNHSKPLIRWERERPQPEARATSEEFHGFPESEIMRGKKRKHVVENSTVGVEMSRKTVLRRSKRIKRLKIDDDFVYK